MSDDTQKLDIRNRNPSKKGGYFLVKQAHDKALMIFMSTVSDSSGPQDSFLSPMP